MKGLLSVLFLFCRFLCRRSARTCIAEAPNSSPFCPLSVSVSLSVTGLSNSVPCETTVQYSSEQSRDRSDHPAWMARMFRLMRGHPIPNNNINSRALTDSSAREDMRSRQRTQIATGAESVLVPIFSPCALCYLDRVRNKQTSTSM